MKALRALMAEADIANYSELARRSGIAQPNMSNIVRGKSRVGGLRLDTIERICNALDCQPGDLLEIRRDCAA